MKDLSKRLDELERKIKSAEDSMIWITARNATVKVDVVGGKHGEAVTFPSVREAAAWIEKQIDARPAVSGSIGFDDLFDLYEDGEQMREVIKPPESMRMQPLLFGRLKTPGPADVRQWAFCNLIWQNYNNVAFHQRFKTGTLNDDDIMGFLALFEIYAWDKTDKTPPQLLDEFRRLFHQVARLPEFASVAAANTVTES